MTWHIFSTVKEKLSKTYSESPVNNAGSQLLPLSLLLTGISPFNYVVHDITSTIVIWSTPGEVAGFRFNVRNNNIPWWCRAICGGKRKRHNTTTKETEQITMTYLMT